MITEDALFATVRAIAQRVTSNPANKDQVAAAIEYAVIPAYSQARDLWAECLTVPAASFVARVTEYFRRTPRVTTHVVSHLLKTVNRGRGKPRRYVTLLFV